MRAVLCVSIVQYIMDDTLGGGRIGLDQREVDERE